MKKIILAILLAMAGVSVFAQLEGIYVEEIPVTQAAADADPNLTTNHVAYRVFVDMAADNEFQLVQGAFTQPLIIETTTSFYNDENDGALQPFFRPLPTQDAPQYYDSWVTLGAYSERTSETQIVPMSEDTDGTVDGFFGPAIALATNFSPGLDLSMFDYTPTGASLNVEDASIYVGGSVPGAGPSNMICIGQFTTDGYLNMELNVQIKNMTTGIVTLYVARTPNSAMQQHSDLLTYSNQPNTAPEVVISAPANGDVIAKGDVVTISASATDADGTIASLALYVNDVLEETVAAASNDFSWTCPGGSTATFEVIATDDRGASSNASVSVTINDPAPTIVIFNNPTADVTVDLNPITIEVDASDADEGVTSVDFSINGTSIGSDANDGDNIYSVTYTPTSATSVNVIATATTGVGAEVSFTSSQITFVNAAPVVSIDSPVAPFDIEITHDTTIVATATDVDGTIASVSFYVNGSSFAAATDVDGTDGFSFVYNAASTGAVSIVAKATDNLGAVTYSTALNFNVVFPQNGPAYAIESVTTFCSSSDIFCLPMVTTRAAANILGYDVELKYDNTKVTPTGLVTPGSDLIADGDWASYKMNVVGDTLIRISMFLNGDAPAGTTFTGEGTVFCVGFSRNYSFGDQESTTFTMPVVNESYATYVMTTSAIEGSYTSEKESTFNGSLSFWSDNAKMVYVPLVNAITEIYGDVNPSEVVTPDASGNFVYDINNGENISIDRDVDNAFDMQEVISGQDAYLTALVAVGEEGFIPNVYQIIAMDVNRDGVVSAGDITQMQQRTVANIAEFEQVGGNSKDWVFVASETILSDLSYRVSEFYPYADGIGYSRNDVPAVADIHELPIEGDDCPIITDENYKGILLGDVTGNYAAQPASVELKGGSEDSGLEIVLGTVTINGIVYLNIDADYSENITSYDLSLYYNEDEYSFVEAKDVAQMNERCDEVEDDNKKLIKCTAYNFGKFKSGTLLSIRFEGDEPMNADDITVKTAMINEKEVDLHVSQKELTTNIVEVSDAIVVYPNPANEIVNVSSEAGAEITIVSASGIVVAKKVAEESVTSFDVANIASGLYIVKVISAGTISENSVIIE